ncbi:hypothetical protein RJT34_31187 [Clitoria ternatea]|uniref:Uncharacterized protein n=1 Tax=Clitoria ternatea TaxID=43366 RepID=A0AAN9EY67_CLITE
METFSIVIIETQYAFSIVEAFGEEWGFEDYAIEEAHRFSGGLWILKEASSKTLSLKDMISNWKCDFNDLATVITTSCSKSPNISPRHASTPTYFIPSSLASTSPVSTTIPFLADFEALLLALYTTETKSHNGKISSSLPSAISLSVKPLSLIPLLSISFLSPWNLNSLSNPLIVKELIALKINEESDDGIWAKLRPGYAYGL